MPLDPRFSALISALAGAASAGAPQGSAPDPSQSLQAAATAAPDILSNAGTTAALAGAGAPSPAASTAANIEGMRLGAENPQYQNQTQMQNQQAPGYGSVQNQQTALGGASMQAPATMPVTAVNQGMQSAQTPTELGFWDKIAQNLSGRTPTGEKLSGEALQDFQKGHAMGGFLGALGAAIGGDTTGGRLGQAVYKQAAGGLSALNNERRQDEANQFLQSALNTFAGKPAYQPQVGAETGGSQTIASMASSPTSTLASLDDSLNRMRRLGGFL